MHTTVGLLLGTPYRQVPLLLEKLFAIPILITMLVWIGIIIIGLVGLCIFFRRFPLLFVLLIGWSVISSILQIDGHDGAAIDAIACAVLAVLVAIYVRSRLTSRQDHSWTPRSSKRSSSSASTSS